VLPEALPEDLRSSPNFVVEVDAMPGGYVCSGTLKGFPKTSVREAAEGAKSLHKLFSKDQRAFFSEHAPDGVGLDDLALLGPIFVLKLKGTPVDFGRKLVVELWLYPDGARILELSTKCAPPEAFQVAAEARAYLSGCGIEQASGQQTKTRKALAYFSKNLP
jgi:hypothetical protein